MNVKFFDIEGNITDAVADGAALNDKTNNPDALINKNINHGGEGEGLLGAGNMETEDYDTSMQQLDDIDRQIKELEDML